MQSTRTILLALLAVVILMTASYSVGRHQATLPTKTGSATTAKPNPTQFKDYTNPAMKFSLKMPATWTTTEQANAVFFVSPERQAALKDNKAVRIFDFEVRTSPNVAGLANGAGLTTLDEWVTKNATVLGMENQKPFTLGNAKGYQWTNKTLGYTIILLQGKDQIYHIESGEKITPDEQTMLTSLNLQ